MYDSGCIFKADSEDAAVDLAKTEMALFAFAVGKVFGDDPVGVGKGILGQGKRYPVFLWFSVSLSSSHSNRVFFMGSD